METKQIVRHERTKTNYKITEIKLKINFSDRSWRII